jgi:hypothetical protein
MLTYQRIIFQSRAKVAYDLVFHLEHLARELCRYGYIIGDSMMVEFGEDPRTVWLSAYFTGKDAWKTALKDERDHVGFHLEEARLVARGEPRILRLKPPRPAPVPSCKCPKSAKPPLDLWCTPESKCPPLLCSEGGVVEYYKLPLSFESIQRLELWQRTVTNIAQLRLALDHEPYEKWAAKELRSKTSWIGKESKSLATDLTKELGRKVRAFRPPVDLMRL